MFYFTKQEKIIILFLTGAIILGLGVQWARGRGALTSFESVKTERLANHGAVRTINKKININTASIGELDTLPGIGPKIAAEIIKYREKSGGFKVIEDIKKVRGIGEKKFSKIREQITVNDKETK
ncbi:MAG: ComEA family DNA-binding protein [bacterium]